MKAIAINGSPRSGGNTEFMLRKVLEQLDENGWETELVKVGASGIKGCTACRKCAETLDLSCIMKDDIFNDIFKKIIDADAVIIGSPTYFTDVTAETKAIIDRTGIVARANGKALTGKIGAAVVALRRGGGVHAYDSINHMFLMSQMVIPGSTYWNIGFGGAKEEVKEDVEAITNMKNLGQMINWLGTSLIPNMDKVPKA